jgi:hypothetical protein
MFAKESLVAKRRLARRLKAAASIAIALAAGTFLACKQKADEIKKAIDSARGDEDAGAGANTNPERDSGVVVQVDTGPDTTALAKMDAAPDAHVVDVKEHKKGMPVPDNLLE